MNNIIKNIFVFDLDGTLMKQSESKIEKESLVALKEVSQYGDIVLASARPMMGIQNLVLENDISIKHFISLNGALIISDHILNTITYPISPSVVDFFLNCSGLFENLWFYTETGWYSNTKNSKEYFVEKNAVLFDAILLENYWKTIDVLKITIVSNLAGDLIKSLQDRFISELEIGFSNKNYIEIHSINANKYLATKQLFNNSKVRIFSFGDSSNDVELLKASFFSCVVDNGTNQAKQVANYVSKFSFGKGVLDSVEFVRDNFLK